MFCLYVRSFIILFAARNFTLFAAAPFKFPELAHERPLLLAGHDIVVAICDTVHHHAGVVLEMSFFRSVSWEKKIIIQVGFIISHCGKMTADPLLYWTFFPVYG